MACRNWKEVGEVGEEEEEEASIAEVASVAVGCRAACLGQGLHCPWTDPSPREDLAGWEPHG